MAPRNGVSTETVMLIWRAFAVFAERNREREDVVAEGCLATEGSEAFLVCTSAVGAFCDAMATEYDALVGLLKNKNVFGHFCCEGRCGREGSCAAAKFGAFQTFLDAMQVARADCTQLQALSCHAERKRYELASYVAAWVPDSQSGVVMTLCDEFIVSSSTGSRIQEFNLGDEPSFNVLASRALDARDINGADAHSERLGTALMSRPYAVETLVWTSGPPGEKDEADGSCEGEEEEDDDDDGESSESGESKKRKRKGTPKGKAKSSLVAFTPPAASHGRIEKVCELLSNSTVAWDPKVQNQPGNVAFNRSSDHRRAGKYELNSLPLHLSRRYKSFTYDPVRRHSCAGGFAALCAAIDAVHAGRTVDRIHFSPGGGDSMAVGGWGARHPERHAGGDYNTFAGPIALEKQVEYRLPLVKATVAGPAFCATWLETRACAQPVLEFASLLLKPQILISLVPEHGSIHVDHTAFPEKGHRPGDPAPYTSLRDYGYKLGSSPKVSALLRDTMRSVGTGLDRALRFTFEAFIKDPTKTSIAALAAQYAVAPQWASTSTFDGAVAAHYVEPGGAVHATAIKGDDNTQAVAFVVGRLARFLWRHTGEELNVDAVAALVQELIESIPPRSTEPEMLHYAGLWVQADARRDAVYRRRAACVLVGLFFDCGPDGHWWPNAVKEGPGGQRLPSLRDLPAFHNADDSSIGILDAVVVDRESRGHYIGLLEVPKPTERGFSVLIGGHSHCSFTDGNRFVAAAAASALAGSECKLVSGQEASWTIREPQPYAKDGAESTGLAEVLANTLLYDSSWANTRAEKVPFVGILAFKTVDGDPAVKECYYRVLRSDATLSRETTARADYELGADALDPPPWARRSGVSSACNYRYFDKPDDAAGDAMDVDQAPDVSVKLSPGDHPPLVSGLDFSQLFTDHGFERRGMAALQPGDRVYLSLHQTSSWPKGITSRRRGQPMEATHAVLREALPPSEGAPSSRLKLPNALKAVPAPTDTRQPVHPLATPQHGFVVTPVFDVPQKGGQIWVDGLVAFIFFVARMLQTGLQSKTLFGLEGLQGCGKTLLLQYLLCVILGPNCARYVRNLANLMTKDFFQEHINTLALVTDELDQAVLDSNEFKALCDDKTGTLQRKHVNGIERFISFFTLWAAWNPKSKNYLQKVLEGVPDRGRRVVAVAVSSALVSQGKGRKPGGSAAARYIRAFLANQASPWINSAFHNFLMTEVEAGPSFNLQIFGGDSQDETARLRCILFDGELNLWDQFLNFWVSLPEAQLPADGTPVLAIGKDGCPVPSTFGECETNELAVVKHGFVQNKENGLLNMAPVKGSKSAGEGLSVALLNGIEEHGWQDGITIPANLLKQLIDCWYRHRHPHVEGKAKTTVAAGILKELVAKRILAAETDGSFRFERGAIATQMKAVGIAPPPLAHAWYDRVQSKNNKQLLADWWGKSADFRGPSARSFPVVFGLAAKDTAAAAPVV